MAPGAGGIRGPRALSDPGLAWIGAYRGSL